MCNQAHAYVFLLYTLHLEPANNTILTQRKWNATYVDHKRYL